MRKRKRNHLVLILVVLLTSISLGYAFLNQDLVINGTGKVTANNWSIYFDNIVFNSGNVALSTGDSAAVINPTTLTDVTYTITLQKPGDFYEFTVDVVNDGSLDAMVSTVSNTLGGVEIDATHPLPNYLNYSVTYDDGVAIAPNHLLEAGDTETYKVRLEYKTDITANDLPTTNQSLTLTFSVEYVQADSNAIERPLFKLGDYFTMVPDASTYTISSDMTGYEVSGTPTDQTITPNELTLWRVINVNQNGTIEAVSEYVSSTDVYFSGVIGYSNIVGGLQSIAAQYAKAGYTIATRMMGYDGQTLTINDLSELDGSTNTAPSTLSTTDLAAGERAEFGGGLLGDTLYLKDIQLVGDVYKNDTAIYGSTGLKAYIANTNDSTYGYYWLASRNYIYYGSPNWNYDGRSVSNTGTIINIYYLRNYGWGTWNNSDVRNSLRPIITLKSGIQITAGSGTKTIPYTITVS